MKRLVCLLVAVVCLSSFSTFAKDKKGADPEKCNFVGDLVKMALTMQTPVTIEQASAMSSAATSSEYEALYLLVAATQSREESQKLRTSIAQLDKDAADTTNAKAGKKAKKEKAKLIEKTTDDANKALSVADSSKKSLSAEATEDLLKSLTYLSNCIIKDALIVSGTQKIVSDIKAQGTSFETIKKAKAVASVGSDAAGQLTTVKGLASNAVAFANAHEVKVPSASDAMASAGKE